MQVRVAVVGFGGMLPELEATVAGWVRRAFPADRVMVLGDAIVNLAGEPEVPPDTVVVIAGGGSVAWATGPDGLRGGERRLGTHLRRRGERMVARRRSASWDGRPPPQSAG